MIGAHTSISVELWESDWNCRCWCRLYVCARCAWFKAVCARQREDESFFLSMWITYRLSIYVDSILDSVAWFIRFQFTHKSCCCVYCLTFFKCYFAFWVSVFFTQPINWYTIWLRNKFAWKRQKHTIWTTTRSRRRREKKVTIKNGVKTWTSRIFVSVVSDLFTPSAFDLIQSMKSRYPNVIDW